ncbi:MAG: hypothetical protein U0939_02270 [Pirellulales bacterium]
MDEQRSGEGEMMSVEQFQQIESAWQAGGAAAALESLAQQLRGQKKYHELFEALKMQVRHRIGLPLLYGDNSDQLDESLRNQLEEGLIAACREVGTLLLERGRIREGWMYLRPVGDKKAAAELLAQIEPDDDNLEELIDVSLREGVDVGRGFGLVLKHYGTCNAITTFEGEVPRQSRADQQVATALIVRHLHAELLANLRTDISRQEGAAPAEKTLADLVADRPWLFQELTYHVDTTHLAAVVRFARLSEDPAILELAHDLTEYGRRLHSQFQYAGDEPFSENYPSHGLFFAALLGRNVDEALAYFRGKAESVDTHQIGTVAIEVYIDLLARVGRPAAAIEATIQLMPAGQQGLGIAPSLLDLAQRAGEYDRVRAHCQERDDLLGYTAALVKAQR